VQQRSHTARRSRRSSLAGWPQLSAARDLLVGAQLSGALAIFLCFISNNLNPRFQHRAETIQQQLAILQGQPYAFDGVPTYYGAFQNRVLFPLALRGAVSLGPLDSARAIGPTYLVLVLATAFGALLVFWYLLRKQAGASPKLAAAGLGLLAYECVFTFNQGWEHPSDFPDVAFTALLLWAALSHRRLSLLALTLVAGLNRESAVFAGVLWCCLYAWTAPARLRARELAFGAAVSGIGFLFVVGVRWYLGGARAVSDGNFSEIPVALTKIANDLSVALHPTPASWPILLLAMLALPGVWLWWNRAQIDERHGQLLVASGVIFLISVVFGQLSELRDFLTTIVIVAYVAVAVEARVQGRRSGLAGAYAGYVASGPR
jgi:hypothetical protein